MHKTIEALEARIAPAAVFTYTESDGDKVTIKTTAKISNDDFVAYLQANATFDGDLLSLHLHDPAFQKTDLAITVTPGTTGNGKASIGYIEASVDLKNVIIAGDLRGLRAGDMNAGTPAINKLQVENLGGQGAESYFQGDVRSIKILGNLTGDIYSEGSNFNSITVGGSIEVSESIVPTVYAQRIGSLVVGHDMEGQIHAGTIRSVRIGGDIIGGTGVGEASGTIEAGIIKSVRVTGSILGGDDVSSGGIYAENSLGSVFVGGDLRGGAGDHSGHIWGYQELGKVIVLGNVAGGSGSNSAVIGGYGEIGYVYVGKDLAGGTGSDSAWIGSNEGGSLNRVVIGGSIVGNGDHSGRVDASIIGSIRVVGDLKGGDGVASGQISAGGVGSAYIGGSIIGGNGENGGSLNAGGIGSIRVVKDVTGGNGVGSGSILGYTGIDSVKIGGNVTGNAYQSGSIGTPEGSIDSITIGGNLSNTGDAITGIFAAGSIGRVSIGGDAVGGEYQTLGIRAGYSHMSGLSVPSIGSISIKGDVTNFLIEAGVDLDGSATAGATIGSVNIGGNFTTSSIVASVNAGDDGFYGTADDILPPSAPTVVSRIASVVIGGSVAGTPSTDNLSTTDGYGIIAQHIVAAKIGGVKQALKTGAGNDLTAKLLGTTDDVRLVELPVSSAT